MFENNNSEYYKYFRNLSWAKPTKNPTPKSSLFSFSSFSFQPTEFPCQDCPAHPCFLANHRITWPPHAKKSATSLSSWTGLIFSPFLSTRAKDHMAPILLATSIIATKLTSCVLGLCLDPKSFLDFNIIVFLFVFYKHFSNHRLDLKDSFHDLQINCIISFVFIYIFNAPYMCRKIWWDRKS